MRTLLKTLIAVGLAAGAVVLSAPTSGMAHAQGLYIDTPGVHVRVGHPHHRYYRRYYRGYDSYGYAPRYYRGYSTGNGCPPHYSIQDGVCKPYRGY